LTGLCTGICVFDKKLCLVFGMIFYASSILVCRK
jgi:hypothetical protein